MYSRTLKKKFITNDKSDKNANDKNILINTYSMKGDGLCNIKKTNEIEEHAFSMEENKFTIINYQCQ